METNTTIEKKKRGRPLKVKTELTPEEIEAKRQHRLAVAREYRKNHLAYFNEYHKIYHQLHKADNVGRQKVKNEKQPFSVKHFLEQK